MLAHEFLTLNEHLAPKRGESTRFFVFADTVAARSYTRKDNCHGWMGIKFQTLPNSEPSQILLHVELAGQREHASTGSHRHPRA